jgi:hypothetical protein
VRTRRLSILLAVLLAASGCGGSDEKPKPTRATADPVPAALDETESSAEDLIDHAQAGNRAKVVEGGKELRRLAEGPAADVLEKVNAPKAEIASLQELARRVEKLSASARFLQISLVANQVSGLMPGFYARYSNPVPPGVLKLDYLDREAEFRSIANDSSATRRAVDELSDTWSGLRSEVVQAGGAKEAGDYAKHVEAMQRLGKAFDRRTIRKEAAKGLELVDVLEGVFRRR